MITDVRNLLYNDPVLYDLAYPDDDQTLAEKCLRRMSRVAGSPIESTLDLGCGTGRVLAGLAERCKVVAGIDINPLMVKAASQRCPNVPILAADMRCARLGRTFDAIIMLGNVLTYVQSNDDLRRSIRTLTTHSHPGTIVMLSMFNPFRLLALKAAAIEQAFRFTAKGKSYVGSASFHLDPRRQRIVRRRRWTIDGMPADDDHCSYRMFFPQELEFVFGAAGFDVVALSDDIDREDGQFHESQQLFLIARYVGRST